jgi:hypothetical protein
MTITIYNTSDNNIYFIYFKWYLMICIFCLVLVMTFKYLKLSRYFNFNNDNEYNTNNYDNNIDNDINTDTDYNKDKVKNNNNNNKISNINSSNKQKKQLNNNKIHKEIKLNKPSNIFYIYWTGGYDSTYRLCEMLIIEKKIVQPLYVKYALDNDCPKSEETCNKKWVRRNRDQELIAMKNIRKTIIKKFPWCKKILLPTIYITHDIDDKPFNKYFEAKFYKNNLWPTKRSKHQYLFLSKYAYYHKIYIDTGVLGIHNTTVFGKFLEKYLQPIEEKYKSPVKNETLKSMNMCIKPTLVQIVEVLKGKEIKEKHYMHYLRFPCFGKTKKDLLIKAKKHNFDNILIKSWSCWFPDKNTGKECGKCPMCKERVVKHPENYTDIKIIK